MEIFLSYGHDNYSDIILDIQKLLEKEGFSVWIDKNRLQPSSDWEEKIEEAIKKHEKFIFCITPHSVRRPDGYCLNEISYAVMLKKEIIPIMIDDSGAMPPLSICRLQWLDLLNIHNLKGEEYTKKLHNVVETLSSIVKNESSVNLSDRYTSLNGILSPEDFSLDIEKHTAKFVGRKWIIDEIMAWSKDIETSRILWISAGAGYGKSALSANITHKIPNVIGVFFCQYNQENRRSAKKFLNTLAYQLSTQIPDYKIILDTFSEKDFQLYSLNNYDFLNKVLLEPLHKINLEEVYVLVVDALDEAYGNENENEILELISNEFIKFPKEIKFLITSRPESGIKQALAHMSMCELSAQREENKNDLIDYINEYLRNKTISPEKKDEIIFKSEGNILYLQEVIKEINSGALNVESLDEFPKGLAGTYERYFKRKFTDIEEYEEKYMGLLELLVSSRKPIDKNLLGDILKIKKREFKKVVSKFGTLIEEEDNKLFFYHKSIIDWLMSEEYCSENYWIDIEEGRDKLYNYFFNDFENANYTPDLIELFPFSKVPSSHKHYYLALQEISEKFIENKNYDEAEKFAKQLLHNYKKTMGENDELTLNYMMRYVEILLLKAEFTKAENMVKEIIQKREVLLGSMHEKTLYAMEKLAYIFRRKGEYKLAAQYYRKILDSKEEKNLEYFSISKEYALVLVYLSNFMQAGKELEKALAFFQKQEKTEVNLLQLAKIENFLCFNMRFINQHNKAVKHIQNSIEIQEEYQSDLDVKISLAASYNNYATTCIEMNDLAIAKVYLDKSLEIRNELFSQEHPDILVSKTSEGVYYYMLGDLEKAFSIFTNVLEQRRKIYDANHSYISRSVRDLAKCSLKMKNYVEARILFNEALVLRVRSFGIDHPVVANIYYDLAKCSYYENNIKDAEENLGTSFNLYKKLYVEDPDSWYYFLHKILLIRVNIFKQKDFNNLLKEIETNYLGELTDDLALKNASYFDFEFKY